MIMINPPILIKKTKPSNRIKKIPIPNDNVKSLKKPIITIDLVLPKKEKKRKVKSLSTIEVPRSIRSGQIINQTV